MNKKSIQGAPKRSERSRNCEAPLVKATGRRSDGRAAKDCVLTWGDLAIRHEAEARQGRREESAETPQGGPLSPLLANVLLDEVDKELSSRGHAFVRYADDCNVYLRSRRAAERVMVLMERLFTKLHLRINASKSAVDHVRNRKLLGFTFWMGRGGKSKVRIAPKSLSRFKERVRELTRRRRGRSVQQVVDELTEYLRGWRAYYKRAEVFGTFPALDRWIHTRLRTLQAKHWKHASPIYKGLAKLGIPTYFAMLCAKAAGRWHHLGASRSLEVAMPRGHFANMGLLMLAK